MLGCCILVTGTIKLKTGIARNPGKIKAGTVPLPLRRLFQCVSSGQGSETSIFEIKRATIVAHGRSVIQFEKAHPETGLILNN
jgi:hypothetical protein